MKLRSIELVLPRAAEASAFMTDIWGMAPAEVRGDTHYLRGSGSYPYLVALAEGADEYVRRWDIEYAGAAGQCDAHARIGPCTRPIAPAAVRLAPVLEGRINLTTATSEELQLLPGVGPATAEKIIAYRERYPIRSIVQLKRIKGIGPKRYEAMRPYLAVEGETTLRVTSP